MNTNIVWIIFSILSKSLKCLILGLHRRALIQADRDFTYLYTLRNYWQNVSKISWALDLLLSLLPI